MAAVTTAVEGAAVEEELAAACAWAFGAGEQGPCRVAEVSEGTYSQLRPVEATDGEGDALSVCRMASVILKEPNVELTDGVRGAGTAAARFPSPPLPPEAA